MIGNRKKVLVIFRDSLLKERGTPLRVKSLLKEVSKDDEIKLFTATRDSASVLGAEHLQLGISNFDNVVQLQRFIKKNKIDVVVFHTIGAGYYILPLLLFGGGYKRVLEMHGFFEEEARLYNDTTFFGYHRHKFAYAVIYKLCHLITTCSDTARDKLLKYNRNTHTVYGGVDLDLFKPTSKEEGATRAEGKTKIVIGYAGNARKWQGVEFLLESFRKLADKDQSFSLRLLFSEKVTHLDLSGISVYQSLPHNKVQQFISDCDILVIPRLENEVNRLSFPSKLMEYLASGKPVVASKTSDVHKIITHGESGMLYVPGDVEGFIKCMTSLKDPVSRGRLGHNGYMLARDNYSWEIQGALFSRLLKGVYGK